jgi:hypothetical protein
MNMRRIKLIRRCVFRDQPDKILQRAIQHPIDVAAQESALLRAISRDQSSFESLVSGASGHMAYNDENKGKPFFVEVVENDIMTGCPQVVPNRMRDSVIQAVRIRMTENNQYVHFLLPPQGAARRTQRRETGTRAPI